MVSHTRDADDDSDNDGSCDVEWCGGTALDTAYCYKHHSKYGGDERSDGFDI